MARKKLSKKNNQLPALFFLFFLLLFSLLGFLTPKIKTIFKNKAAENNFISGNYQLVRNLTNKITPDWQTNELYRYDLIYDLDTQNIKNNLYPIKIILYDTYTNLPKIIYGQTIQNIQYENNQTNKLKFSLNQIERKYESDWLMTNSQNCFDLFKTQSYSLTDYIGTSCYSLELLKKNNSNSSYRLYSPNTTMFIDFLYKGDDLLVLSASPLFDRKDTYYTQPLIWNNPMGERVVYFTYDYRVKNRSFSQLKYTISGKMVPDNEQLYRFNNYICGLVKDDYFYPQLHRTLNTSFPQGGEFIDYKEKIGYCSFSYTSNYFLYGYLSHSPMVEKIETTPTPTPTPTPTTCPPVVCDINGDGKEDINDGNLIKSCLNKSASGSCAKVNVNCSDNVITVTDVQRFSYQCPHIFQTPTPTPTLKLSKPRPTVGPCKNGQTNPYYLKVFQRCLKVIGCGISNCKP
jgi:hypothetical protein